MEHFVTRCAQGDQVLVRIVSLPTAKLLMVNFEARHCTTPLASPAIAAQHLSLQPFVSDRI